MPKTKGNILWIELEWATLHKKKQFPLKKKKYIKTTIKLKKDKKKINTRNKIKISKHKKK